MITPAFLNKSAATFRTAGRHTVPLTDFEQARHGDNDSSLAVQDAAKSVNQIDQKMDSVSKCDSWVTLRTKLDNGSTLIEPFPQGGGGYYSFTSPLPSGPGQRQYHQSFEDTDLIVDSNGTPESMTMDEHHTRSVGHFSRDWGEHTDYRREGDIEQYDTWSTGSQEARSVVIDNANQTVTILDFKMS